MKKRILLLLVAMIGMATSAGWADSVITNEFFQNFPNKPTSWNLGYTFVYANGNPITITEGSSDDKVKISVDDSDEYLEIELSKNPVIFGGSKNAEVSASTITMTSGKINMLFGGGYGEKTDNPTPAKIAGKTTIKMSGGTITNSLIGGGLYYSLSNAVDINLSGTASVGAKGSWIICGGFESGVTTGTNYTTFNNTVESVTLAIDGGTYGYIALGGTDGNKGKTGTTTATVKNATIIGGVFGNASNGCSEAVTGTFTNCTFSKTTANPIEIAAVNRGIAKKVTMTFNGCTFPQNAADIYANLGATYRWGYNYNGSSSKVEGVPGEVTFAFDESCKNVPVIGVSDGLAAADVTLTGAKAKLDKFEWNNNQFHTDFTIDADKTWTFNNGLGIANDVTLTKTGTLAVKGTLTVLKVDQLAMALSSVTKGGTIDLSSVTADVMLGELNKGEKKELSAAICIKCSDATVYTDMASAQQSTVSGTVKYIKLAEETYSLETPDALTVKPTIETLPTASTIEAGQPLSTSILSDGIAVIKGEKEVVVNGVFAWADPSAKVTAGTNSYDVVFTPSDLTKYEVVKDIKVTIQDVKQYYTVTIGKCDNGKIEVTDGNSAGKYEDKKVLVVKAIPNEHYDFSAWGEGITGVADNGSYTVSKNAVLSATFVAKNYAVTIGDNVKVTKQDGTSVSTGNLPYGTILNVVAAPTEEVGSLKALTCNDKEVINNTVTVDGNLNIQATFNAIVASTYRITAGAMTNGKIQLFDVKGNAIAFGSALTKDTEVSVVAVPDPGYELDGSVTVADATYANGKFTVGEKAVTVSATFKPKKYKVEIAAEHATITLDKSGEQDYGTSIQITEAKAADDYKLLAVVVNGKEIAKGESFTVKGDTKVNAVVQALPKVVFTDKEQTYTYNKAAQPFVVRTVPAGISGITVTYKQGESVVQSPTDAGTYKVFASLDVNSSYASMSAEEIGTLIIEKAPYPAAAIPTASQIVTDNDNENEYHWRSSDDADQNFRTAYYKFPANSNYREPEFVIPATTELESSLTKVTLGNGWVKTRSAESVSLTLNATNGSVSVWNGDAQVTEGTSLYAGQKLTLKAIPTDATYSIRPTWSNNVTVDNNGVASITLSKDAATVTATFKGKDDAPFTSKVYTSIYTGTAFGDKAAPTVKSDVSGWLVTFKQGDVTFDEPTAVGEYQMIASRPADDVYKAAEAKEVGTLKITKAEAVISDVVGTDITTIQTLNQSVISGTANVEGSFSWVTPDAKLTAGTHANIAVLFTPADNNYAPVNGTATVNVTASASGIAVRTIELTESDPANGNGVVLTLNGTTVTAGTTVKAGNKLTATFSAKSGYTATAKINDASYASGTEYVVEDEAGNVSIVVTYTKNQTIDPNPGTDPDPDPVVDVTGVSLDKSELTLAVKGTYTLKATVAPADADNKNVTWKSSDDKIATVDKDGKVTAVAIGKATITVTTEDGGKTATCVVTVDAATGLEELIANTRVYGQDHAIRIEPAMSVNVLVVSMNGQLIYNDIVSSATQIPVPAAGIYIVKLGTGNDTSVRKVSVK